MRTVHSIAEVQSIINAQRSKGLRIAFVPTMGIP